MIPSNLYALVSASICLAFSMITPTIMTNDVPISEMLEIWNTPDKTIGTVATIEIPIPPRSVVCLTFFLRYSAVSAPGLIPGI